ncbi:MazG nucleotide pyrophosphohydrolase domain-containing protein [Arthrobacter bussei]|uniref:MazG nucleotide pyrophosphohydrolase domain-containing protein n=1 Tax=Arthrobacter bussei TaxID=2594179 RepID=UPI0019D59013|nr:MazG nucleotide pyrophosphohydrolase domain-containing protein [Arthrobacter bussei]
MLKLHEEVGELTQAYLMKVGQARDKELSPAEINNNFAAELADVLGQVLLLVRHHDVDLESAITSK